MALLFPNQGEQLALSHILNKTAPENLTLRLFQNNYTPIETTIETDLTEATFTGYSAISLTAANWTIPDGGPATYAEQTFTSTAGSQNQDVYGYYLTQDTSGKLLYAELFTDGPYNIANDQDKINVTLSVGAD